MSLVIPLLTLSLGVTPAAYLFLSKRIIDVLAAGIQNGGTSASLETLGWYVFVALAVKTFFVVCRECHWLGEQLFHRRLVGFLQHEVIAKAMMLDLASFESSTFYDRLQRADSEVCYRPFAVLGSIMSVGQLAITMLSCLLILSTFSVWIVPTVFLVTLPPLLVQAHYGRIRWAVLYHHSADERKMHYLKQLATKVEGFSEIRICGLQNYLLSNWRALSDTLYDQEKAVTVRYAAALMATSIVQVACIMGFYLLVLRDALFGAITIGSVVMLTQAMEQCLGTMGGIVQGMGVLHQSSLFLTNLFEYFQHQPGLLEPESPVPLPQRICGRLELIHVSFTYPGTDRQVLSDLTLTIDAGERVALVGENGAGKSTIVKLLARLYDPHAGAISVDGIDLQTVSSGEWQRRLAVVFQEHMRYNLTVRENVGFGSVSNMDDDGRLDAATDEAGAARIVSKLPNRWETILGRMFEGGIELSRGEWQQVALARALFASADIYILDEPSASLDAKLEYDLFQRFDKMTKGKTTVLISHRLSCATLVDRIYFLESGQVVEVGSHQQLMARGGKYAAMYRRQADGYAL